MSGRGHESLGSCSLEKSRLLHSSEPDRILQPRPVLTLTMKDDGAQEVKCRCTLQGFKDPDILDLLPDRKTESSTLSTNGRAMFLQLIASCRFVLTVGDVKRHLGWLTRRKKPQHPDQLFEVRGGYGLGDQPQQWWRTFEKFLAEQLGFDQHSMDPCVHSERSLEPLEQGAR